VVEVVVSTGTPSGPLHRCQAGLFLCIGLLDDFQRDVENWR
jgi:hypothetical protein